MNFLKSLFSKNMTLSGEEDAQKEKQKVVDVFNSDKTVGDILYRKEFLILDHKIKGSIVFKGRFLAYKDLVLTNKGVYIVGVPSVEHFEYNKISSIVSGDTSIEMIVSGKNMYLYETALPLGNLGNAFADVKITEQRKEDFSKIKSICESNGYHQ